MRATAEGLAPCGVCDSEAFRYCPAGRELAEAARDAFDRWTRQLRITGEDSERLAADYIEAAERYRRHLGILSLQE